MKPNIYCLLFLFIILIIPVFVFSQPGKPLISKEPVWITKNKIDYSNSNLDKDATDGYIDMAIERQLLLADQSEYWKRSIKILTQAGVQNGSQVSISYDPSYQQLILHSVNIVRNGETLNRLVPKDIKILHQEKELKNFIYNGTLEALLILEDVRVGDVIEYSYTIKGFNPIFKNKYASWFSMRFGFPVYQLYYKIIVPEGRKINVKNFNDSFDQSVSELGGQKVYEWKDDNIRQLTLQDDTPSWYDPFPQFMVSEYDNWKEVNDWAIGLFPGQTQLSPAVKTKIGDIEKKYTDAEGKITAALRFVQDDIRYMGIEMGENTHRPADPSKVFTQRFGDCKEKSYLLCCMLWAMNIEADPVLINTDARKEVFNYLPAPIDFNHVTIRVKLNNIYYWLDPTISFQRGKVRNLFFPDYQAGLVIKEGNTELTKIDFRNINYTKVKEHFKVARMSGSGSLTVTTIYLGHAADDIRSEFNNKSTNELINEYQKFYATYFDEIVADSLSYVDNDSTGVFTTNEYYTIHGFWNIDKNNVHTFTFSSFVINSILSRPKERNRRMPVNLAYPAKYQEESIVDLPEKWSVTENELHLKNSCYTYNSKFYYSGNHVYLKTNYESLKDHASINDAETYFDDLNEFEKQSSFELSTGKDEPVKPSKPSSPGAARNIVIIVLLVFFVAGIFVSRRQQKN